jgi:hypothetical protein
MRGWSAIVVGFLLLGLAVWSFAWDGFSSSTLLCATAAAFIFFRGAQGMEINEVGDPLAVIEFVRNPADAIVDSATERLSDWFDNQPDSPTAGEEKFDPEAVVARYLEQRGSEPAAAPPAEPPVPAPMRSFGRKGL